MLGIGNLFSSVVDGISGHFKGKQELKKAKIEAQKIIIQAEADTKKAIALSKVKMAENGQMIDANLDEIAMKQMASSWKDEFIMFIFYIPVILAFIPVTQQYALEGFEVMKQMPDWYQYSIIGILVVTFGMRGLLKSLLSKKIPNLNLKNTHPGHPNIKPFNKVK